MIRGIRSKIGWYTRIIIRPFSKTKAINGSIGAFRPIKSIQDDMDSAP